MYDPYNISQKRKTGICF